MRRKRRSVFPFILLLCLILLLLVGARQHFVAEGSSLTFGSMLEQLLPEKEKNIPDEESSAAADYLPSSTESVSEPLSEADDPVTVMDNCYTYYYHQLTEAEQALYRRLYSCVSAREDSITLDTADSDTVHRIYHFVLYDHPELFWCVGSSQSHVYTDKIEFMPEYSCSTKEIASRTAEIEAQADACLSGLEENASDYEKVRYVYTWLVNTVDYDENASDNQNIYSSLVGHASVCAGYAKGMQYLLNRLSVPCIYLTGILSKGGTHAWNMVCCSGSWYQTDATFGDPVFAYTEDIPEDNLSYAYLCCTDAQIRGSHIPDGEVSYPACNSMDLNYYVQNGWFVWSCDETALTDLVASAVMDGQDGFTLQCANSDTYRQVCDMLLDTIVPAVSQTYMEMHNLKQVNYKYSKDADMLVFSLYWTRE